MRVSQDDKPSISTSRPMVLRQTFPARAIRLRRVSPSWYCPSYAVTFASLNIVGEGPEKYACRLYTSL